MYLNAFVPFELRDVCEPLLVGLVRVELAVEQILRDVLRILRPPGAAVVAVLDGGLDAPGAADAQNALVIDVDIVIVAQLVVDTPITLVRAFHVDPLHFFGEYLVLCRSSADLSADPFILIYQ